MPKINQEEYEILISLDERAKSIVRQDRGRLWVAEQPIMKDDIGWYVEDGFDVELEDDEIHLFQFIQWEDEEPYNIQKLIEEYEHSTKHVTHVVDERVEAIKNVWSESEETEVKDIEWLKKSIDKRIKTIESDDITFVGSGYYDEGYIDGMRDVLYRINQLDDPEVLSQKWIDENKTSIDRKLDGTPIYKVREELLQNLLVPKQEEITEEQAWEVLSKTYDIPNKSYIREAMRVVADYVGDETTLGELKEQLAKPVIPQFVADWIESKDYHIEELFEEIIRDTLPKSVNKWIIDNRKSEENSYVFTARLFIDGYEIEQEPKYYVEDNHSSLLIKVKDKIKRYEKNTNYDYIDNTFALTEQEIKDYDPRYWTFAKPVEEVEE